jgi:hypothetical protein
VKSGRAEPKPSAVGDSSSSSSIDANTLRGVLESAKRQYDQSVHEVQARSQRWQQASAARECQVQAVGGLLLSLTLAAATISAGSDTKADGKSDSTAASSQNLAHAVRNAMHELGSALATHQPTFDRLLKDVEHKLRAERTENAKMCDTASAAVNQVMAGYRSIVASAETHARSLDALRGRWLQYKGWLSVFHSKPPKDTVRRLGILKVDLEHAEDEEERHRIAGQISELGAEARAFRIRWRTARDQLIECLNSGYFAHQEKDDALKHMLLRDRFLRIGGF